MSCLQNLMKCGELLLKRFGITEWLFTSSERFERQYSLQQITSTVKQFFSTLRLLFFFSGIATTEFCSRI